MPDLQIQIFQPALMSESLKRPSETQPRVFRRPFSAKIPYRSTRKYRRTIMQVTTSAITNGEFADKYGKRGSQFSENGMPTYSIPFEISGAPEGTQSFAVVLEDKDAITASGFVWIHWLIADLTRTSVAENDSIAATDYVQQAVA